MDIQLSPHFFLSELTVSQTAARKRILNSPNQSQIRKLKLLCIHLLEPIRDMYDSPLVVSSGFRSVEVNRLVGGAANSQHMSGEAADFTIPGVNLIKLYQDIKNSKLPYDQLILEFGVWIHISYSLRNRRQSFEMR